MVFQEVHSRKCAILHPRHSDVAKSQGGHEAGQYVCGQSMLELQVVLYSILSSLRSNDMLSTPAAFSHTCHGHRISSSTALHAMCSSVPPSFLPLHLAYSFVVVALCHTHRVYVCLNSFMHTNSFLSLMSRWSGSILLLSAAPQILAHL